MFEPKERVLKYEEKSLIIELQGEIGETTISVGDFNTPCIRNVQFQWQTSKDIVEFNIISQLDVIDRCSRGTFAKLDHILDCKIHLKKLKRIEIIQCLFSDHNGTKLKVRSTRQSERPKILKQHVSKWSMD